MKSGLVQVRQEIGILAQTGIAACNRVALFARQSVDHKALGAIRWNLEVRGLGLF
jgi:hypothetical protein